MSIAYRIYSNHGTGGTVDYSSPIAVVSTLSYAINPIAPSSDNTFVVHAYDSSTNLEEANSDARVRIVLDLQGNDVTSRPVPVQSLFLMPSLGGGGRAAWAWTPNSGLTPPAQFIVNLLQGTTTTATANVPYQPGTIGYSWVFAGPLAPAVYLVTVTAIGIGGLTSPSSSATANLGIASSPFIIDSLVIQ